MAAGGRLSPERSEERERMKERAAVQR